MLPHMLRRPQQAPTGGTHLMPEPSSEEMLLLVGELLPSPMPSSTLTRLPPPARSARVRAGGWVREATT